MKSLEKLRKTIILLLTSSHVWLVRGHDFKVLFECLEILKVLSFKSLKNILGWFLVPTRATSLEMKFRHNVKFGLEVLSFPFLSYFADLRS